MVSSFVGSRPQLLTIELLQLLERHTHQWARSCGERPSPFIPQCLEEGKEESSRDAFTNSVVDASLVFLHVVDILLEIGRLIIVEV